MASKITNQTYLVVTLSDESETFTRDYRVDNPREDVTTLAQVETAFAPAFAVTGTDEPETFFQDDATSAWLTKVKGVVKTQVTKTETPFE